ncbi:MAG: PhzF family phenazine biosynthesis protein [Blastocatellia bacterium]|nr:PhzF family phenazine biosynthesis protein [Blastocatellia bacterium]
MKLDIYQVDAFTSVPFKGNPAAVVPLDSWLDDEVLLNIAAENNLAETAFFVKDGDAFELRWFTPTVEMPLCGHATLASAYVLFEELGFEGETIRFKTRKRGDLNVSRDGDRFVLDFPAYPMIEIEPIEMLVNAEVPPLKYWESQDNMLFLLVKDQKTVETLEPDMSDVLKLPYDEVIVMAKGDDCDFASRMFAPKIGIPEDPVTGAIHCSLIPHWAGELGKNELFARQVSPRGGELYCELVGDRVRIGGNAVLYLKGEIYVDAGKSIAA